MDPFEEAMNDYFAGQMDQPSPHSPESQTVEELWDDDYMSSPESQTVEDYMNTPESQTFEELWNDDELREILDLPSPHTPQRESEESWNARESEESWNAYFTSESDDDDSMSYEENVELQERVGSVTIGLPPETLAALPEIAFKKQADEGNGERCTVCLDDYEDGEIVLQLPCSHIFHGHCVPEWFKTQKTCPLCRHGVVIEKNEDSREDADG